METTAPIACRVDRVREGQDQVARLRGAQEMNNRKDQVMAGCEDTTLLQMHPAKSRETPTPGSLGRRVSLASLTSRDCGNPSAGRV